MQGMTDWTPQQYQDWWRAILAPYLPWIKVAVVALVVEALTSIIFLIAWWRGGVR